MVTKKQKEKYLKDGYVLLPKLLDKNDVKKIKIDAQEIFRKMLKKNRIYDDGTESGFEKAVYILFKSNFKDFIGAAKAAQHIISLQRICLSEKIIKVVRGLGLEEPIVCVKPIIYFNSRHIAKIEGHYKTPSHQDWRSMQGSLNSIVIWSPLVNTDINLGAIEVVPKSHLQGLVETEKDEWFRHIPETVAPISSFVPVEVNIGDVVAFSAFTIHRSGNNVTENIRWSIHMRYNDASEKTFLDRSMPHPYTIYHPEQEIITKGFPTTTHLSKIFKN